MKNQIAIKRRNKQKEQNIYLEEAKKVVKYTLITYASVIFVSIIYMILQLKNIATQDALQLMIRDTFKVVESVVIVVSITAGVWLSIIIMKQIMDRRMEKNGVLDEKILVEEFKNKSILRR